MCLDSIEIKKIDHLILKNEFNEKVIKSQNDIIESQKVFINKQNRRNKFHKIKEFLLIVVIGTLVIKTI